MVPPPKGCERYKAYAHGCHWKFFKPMELEEGGGQSMDLNIVVQNILTIMRAMLGLFKSLTNFSLTKFEELAYSLWSPPSFVM
jgi:hypothetical protein